MQPVVLRAGLDMVTEKVPIVRHKFTARNISAVVGREVRICPKF